VKHVSVVQRPLVANWRSPGHDREGVFVVDFFIDIPRDIASGLHGEIPDNAIPFAPYPVKPLIAVHPVVDIKSAATIVRAKYDGVVMGSVGFFTVFSGDEVSYFALLTQAFEKVLHMRHVQFFWSICICQCDKAGLLVILSLVIHPDSPLFAACGCTAYALTAGDDVIRVDLIPLFGKGDVAGAVTQRVWDLPGRPAVVAGHYRIVPPRRRDRLGEFIL